MRCVDCRWFHKENEICLKDDGYVFGIYIDRECEYVNNMTVFEKITASHETLAEKLVYKALVVGNNRVTYSCWRSTITEESYRTKKEAIDATVDQLREVK